MYDYNEIDKSLSVNINNNIVIQLLSDRSYKIKGDQLSCCCPFHNEKRPSFGINLRTGSYNCFSCDAQGNIVKFVSDILEINTAEAIERIREDGNYEVPSQYYYTLEDYAEEKNFDIDYLTELKLKTRDDGKAVVIPYFDANGNFVANRYRMNTYNKDADFPRFLWEKGAKIIPYGLQYLKNFSSEYIILVERRERLSCTNARGNTSFGYSRLRKF